MFRPAKAIPLANIRWVDLYIPISTHWSLYRDQWCSQYNGLFTQWDCLTWKYLKNKDFRFDLCTFVLSSKLYSRANKRTFPHWINDIHAQQTIWMSFSKYRRSHTVIISIILMNEKSVSISVSIENKTTKIRLSPCVSHFAGTFRYLWMLTSNVTGGCCHISVVSECYGSPLSSWKTRKRFKKEMQQ